MNALQNETENDQHTIRRLLAIAMASKHGFTWFVLKCTVLIHVMLHLLLTVLCHNNLNYGYKTIKQLTEPDLYVTLVDDIVRLRQSHAPYTGMEPNMVRFLPSREKHLIRVNDQYICKASGLNNEIVSCSITPDEKTEWQVFEQANGVAIKHRGMCMKKGKLDSRDETRGHRLVLVECDDEKRPLRKDLLWTIEDVSPVIYNGNLGEDLDMLKEGAPYLRLQHEHVFEHMIGDPLRHRLMEQFEISHAYF